MPPSSEASPPRTFAIPSALRGRDGRSALVATATVVIASFAGQLASRAAVYGWYRTIHKPWYTPPDWVFPVAWTVLFTMMGTAFWRILRRPAGTPLRRAGIALFIAQIVFNAGWSAAFFGERSPLLGLYVIAPFWLLILATTAVFRAIDRLAATLLVPYIAWVSFAALLNFAIWRTN